MRYYAFFLFTVVFAVLLTACSGSDTASPTPTRTGAQTGDVVTVQYTGKLEDGTVFNTTVGKEPLKFVIGDGQMIAGFEAAVIGMKPGESKTVTIAPDQAYGAYDDEMVMMINRAELEADLEKEPKKGQKLVVRDPEGHEVTVTVIDITDTTVTLDFNPPLAGKYVTFDIKLLQVE